jgi:hypothetical protein
LTAQATGINRRAARRLPFFNRVRVVPNGSDRCIDVHAYDLGPGGIYLYGDRPLPDGTRLGIEIETSRHGPVWVRGCEVVWGTNEWFGSRPPGMGVRFLQIPAAARRMIDRIVDDLVEKKREDELRPPSHLRLAAGAKLPHFGDGGVATGSRRLRWWSLLWMAALVAGVNAAAIVLTSSLERPAEAPALVTEPLAPRVGAPVFQLRGGVWELVLQATGPVRVRHFNRVRPARLVIDVLGAEYAAEQTRLRPPVPFVRRVRVGKHPERIRYVIEFKRKRVPGYQVEQRAAGVTVAFRR